MTVGKTTATQCASGEWLGLSANLEPLGENMELLYDGTLDDITYGYVKNCLREYACPVEVEIDDDFWVKFNVFSNTKMRKARKNLEHDDGSPRIYEGPSYSTMHKNAEDDEVFIFFEYESDRKLFLEEFAYLKTNGMPFKTLFK